MVCNDYRGDRDASVRVQFGDVWERDFYCVSVELRRRDRPGIVGAVAPWFGQYRVNVIPVTGKGTTMTLEDMTNAAQTAQTALNAAVSAKAFAEGLSAAVSGGLTVASLTIGLSDGSSKSAAFPLSAEASAALAAQTAAFLAPVVEAETAKAAALIVGAA